MLSLTYYIYYSYSQCKTSVVVHLRSLDDDNDMEQDMVFAL